MPSLRRLAALAALAVALGGCDLIRGEASGKTDGVFPFDVIGLALGVEDCGGFGIRDGTPVALHFTGRRFSATADIFEECDVKFVGDGFVEIAGRPGPIFTFRIDAKDDCDDISDTFLNTLRGTVLHTYPDGSVECIALAVGGVPAVACLLDSTCVFELIAPQVRVLFDVQDAVDDVVDDALDNLLPFRSGGVE